MKRFLCSISCVASCLFILGTSIYAADLKAYVEPFAITAKNDTDLTSTLKTLLSTRLGGGILVVDSPAKADLRVQGSYLEIGKAFSIDVTVLNREGEVVARTYEQGGERGEIIAAMTKVGEKLTSLLAGPAKKGEGAGITPTGPTLPAVQQSAPKTAEPAIIRKSAGAPALTRMAGVYYGIAPLTAKDGKGKYAVIKDKALEVVAYDGKVEKVVEAVLDGDDKIVSVDTGDLDGDGQLEIYLTVMRDNDLKSQVWVQKDSKLIRLADNLPYYFRAVSGPGGKRTMYAQQTGKSEDFYGPVYELVKGEKGYGLKNPLKLPKSGNIYNFGMFVDKEGVQYTVVLNSDGFLVVYSESGEELWRSDDKYGGSETYFAKGDQQNIQITGSPVRKVFVEQRITISRAGDVIIPKNSGFWTIGNSRSYSKNTIFGLAWNGAVLEERWRTRDSQAYLADYLFDEATKELVLLEVVKKEGVVEKGASAISVRKLD